MRLPQRKDKETIRNKLKQFALTEKMMKITFSIF